MVFLFYLTWLMLSDIKIQIANAATLNPKGPVCQAAVDIRLPGDMTMYDEMYCHTV
jgi:hypothetical protein